MNKLIKLIKKISHIIQSKNVKNSKNFQINVRQIWIGFFPIRSLVYIPSILQQTRLLL